MPADSAMRTNVFPFKAVLLDIFDTAVYCPWGDLRRQMAATVGVPAESLLAGYSRTQANRNVGAYGGERRDLEEIARAGKLRLSEDQISTLVDFEHEYLMHCGHYYPDVEPFLASVKAKGLISGVISNCSYGAATLIERLNVRKLVDDVFLSFEVGYRKPDPEIYRHALRALGVEPGQALYIDDQVKFCEGAVRIGMPALLMNRSVSDHRQAEYDYPYVSALDVSVLSRADLFMQVAG
jgi:putative hydrolase of the HAD superfamily